MKWYDVKKFKPALNSKVFVITQYGDIWTCNYAYDEEDEICFISDTDNMTLSSVTHFCIPDPVEIEL